MIGVRHQIFSDGAIKVIVSCSTDIMTFMKPVILSKERALRGLLMVKSWNAIAAQSKHGFKDGCIRSHKANDWDSNHSKYSMHTKCDKIRTLSRPSCMICGGRGTALYRDLIDTLFGIAGKWHMKQCENRACGLCWLDPGPVEADIALLDQSYYTHNSARAEGLLGAFRPFFYACYLAAS